VANYKYTVPCRAVSRQRLVKHVPAATDTHVTIEILCETVFLLDPCKGVIRRITEEGLIIFHLLDHVKIWNHSEPTEKFKYWDGFQASPRN
jgi:hypothetical protein